MASREQAEYYEPAYINPESGFRNVSSLGRDVRRVEQDRYKRERERLQARREGYQRHDGPLNMLEQMENTPGYLNSVERFHSDTVGEVRAQHDSDHHRHKAILDRTRQERIEREERIKKEESEKLRKEEESVDQRRQNSRLNESRTRYDLLTLKTKYKEDEPYDRYRDEMHEYAGRSRADQLYRRMNNQEGVDPITGQPLPHRIEVPAKPVPPPPKQQASNPIWLQK